MAPCSCCNFCNEDRRDITLMLVGLDNAGKSVTVRRLIKESIDNVVPTCGFNTFKMFYKKCKITFYDLGGASSIRKIWNFYYNEVYGIIFVVDASNIDRMEECKATLIELLSNDSIKGKPMLLLANKQDKENALEEVEICQLLTLEKIVNLNKCPTRLELCSALKNSKNGKIDPSIWEGFSWLINLIKSDYEQLSFRIQKDLELSKLNCTPEKIRPKKVEEDSLGDVALASNPFIPLDTFKNQVRERPSPKSENVPESLIKAFPHVKPIFDGCGEKATGSEVGITSTNTWCSENLCENQPCASPEKVNTLEPKKIPKLFQTRRSSKVAPLNDPEQLNASPASRQSLPPLVRTPKKFLDDMNTS